MKIHILFELQKGATGGGNQFLKAIKEYFVKVNSYTETVDDADVILFNSHHFIPELLKIKLTYPNKLFIHRIDGPMRLYNTMDDIRDLIVNIINKSIDDGTIFQSNWSKERNLEMGIEKNKFEVTILNAPNPYLFNHDNKVNFNKNRKIKLIATSWSSNIKKGFEIYQWIDENLDFNKYEMTFVGNSPVKFDNIIYKEPMNSEELSTELKQNDVFIFASKIEACSNSLLEALHCGLPVIGYNGSSNTEIIDKSGELFDSAEEIPSLLNKIVNNYEQYQANIILPNITGVGAKYYNFFELIYNAQQKNSYKCKQFSIINYLIIRSTLFIWKVKEKLKSIVKIKKEK